MGIARSKVIVIIVISVIIVLRTPYEELVSRWISLLYCLSVLSISFVVVTLVACRDPKVEASDDFTGLRRLHRPQRTSQA